MAVRKKRVIGATLPASSNADPDMRAEIQSRAIDVRFQPWIHLATGKVAVAEALARSSVEPDNPQLFDRARRIGMAHDLSRCVQSKAIALASRWSGALSRIAVSINLLPSELEDAGHLPWLVDVISSHGCDPSQVIVEITEDALLTGRPTLAVELGRLRAAGVRIALDDFGSGYANLAYLTRLPLDIIKLDRSLVGGLVDGQRDRIVMKAVIDLARELSLEIVVEGVEEPQQLALLSGWGCDYYQGFLGSKALDAAALETFVADRNAIAA